MNASPPPVDAPLLVACLCAEWCGTCREYRPLFAEASRSAASPASFVWIDIEDEPEVTGDLDIDTFPTLLIARGDELLFFGPLTPQAAVLARTLEKASQGDLERLQRPELAGLAERARRFGSPLADAGWAA